MPLPPRLLAISALLGLSLLSGARADAPKLTNLSPAGVQRGVETELTFSGAALAGKPALVLPFAAQVTPPGEAAADGTSWKLRITVPPEVPLGVYPVRVVTEGGISGPILLGIGQWPQVAETEPNNVPEQAQVLSALPVIVEGQAAGADVDFFRFPGRKGQRVVVDAQCARIGSGVDPQVRLTNAARAYLASSEDAPGLGTDARLVAELPEDGDYLVEISDTKYQGSGRSVYRLEIGPAPVVEEVYPLGGRSGETTGLELRGGIVSGVRPAAATLPAVTGPGRVRIPTAMIGLGEPVGDVELPGPLQVSDLAELREAADPAAPPIRSTAPAVLNGRIDPPGDEDRFLLAVTPGQTVRIRVQAAELGSALDGSLQVLKTDGSALAVADDNTAPGVPTRFQPNPAGYVSADPQLNFAVPAGVTEVLLSLRDLEGRGGVGFPYRIVVEQVEPTFDVVLSDSEASVPRAGSALVGLQVARQGYNGAITVNVVDPPAGLSVRPAQIAEGQVVGALSLSAAPDAAFGPTELKVVATGQGPGGPITVPAMKVVVFAQQGAVPLNTGIQTVLPAAPGAPELLRFETPEAPVEVVHGLGGAVPVKLTRNEGADAALALAALPLPPGVTLAETKVAEKAGETTANVGVAREAALGKITIGLTAKGKFGEAERTFALPAVTLDVVRPVAVETPATNLEIKAGNTIELTGKLVRKGAFKEPVTLNLKGLPAGTKADPVTVPPDGDAFTFKIQADPAAAEAMANLQLAPEFKLGDKDYPQPPVPLTLKVTK